MKLSDHDLRQMDEDWLKSLPAPLLLEVSKRLLSDVKALRDRQNQGPDNSSRPPGSQAPWEKAKRSGKGADQAPTQATEPEPEADAPPANRACAPAPASQGEEASGRELRRAPGKQPGAPGFGRTQKLAATDTRVHRPEHCAACGAVRDALAAAHAYTAWDEVDIDAQAEGQIGLRLTVTRHQVLEVRCRCGHASRAVPWRAPADALWDKVELGEWRLIGPRLAGVIVLLALRMRLSRARIRELLMALFALSVSTGLIDQTIREAGRASAPLEEALVVEIQQAAQLHVDETPWPEAGTLLWLWTLVSASAVLYQIGPRSAAMLENVLEERFGGILISDGYGVYRAWPNRLRCWPHLLRKARGLAESTDGRIARAGAAIEALMRTLMGAIYEARQKPPPQPLPVRHAADLERLRTLCAAHHGDAHDALRSFARELHYDWDVIVRPLAEPHLPLSNNAAEQALRHWVISRRISHGTRSPAGTRAFAVLASVVETCRRRGACVWRYLGEVIKAARQGATLPGLPKNGPAGV
jgi:transposase